MKKILFHAIYSLLVLMVCIISLFFIPFVKTFNRLINFNFGNDSGYTYNKMASYQYRENQYWDITNFPEKYINKPGYYYVDFIIKLNKFPYRITVNEEFNDFTPGGILGMGCSFLFGEEINQEDTLLYKTSTMLGVPSYNFAVGSYSLCSMILRLKDLEQNGTFKLLKPKVILVGIGNWQFGRSINPFIPSDFETLQTTYQYLKKMNGKVSISNDYGLFSIKYGYQLRDACLKNKNTLLYYFLCFANTPRFMLSSIVYKFTYANQYYLNKIYNSITAYEVYDYAIREFIKISKRENVKLVIIWLPHTSYSELTTINPDFVEIMHKYKDDLYFCNVNNYFAKHGFPAEDIGRRHPGIKTNEIE